jgi:hypothetical protein
MHSRSRDPRKTEGRALARSLQSSLVMSKRSSRRLSVKKETLRRLGDDQLVKVAGGTAFMGTGTLAGSGPGLVTNFIVASATWTKSWTCETTSVAC